MTGLESRYDVRKINDPAGKHDTCRYFVLDPSHDPHACLALAAYARSCERTEPDLAADLRAWLSALASGDEVQQ